MKIRPQFLVLAGVVAALTVASAQFSVYHYERTENLATVADFTSFSGTLAWISSAGYFLMFIAMVVEGPVVTAAAAFAAALGYFNILIVLLLSILGDLAGDYIYYIIGYFGRVAFVEKYGHRVGLTAERIERMERLIKEHPKKTLVAIKLAPVLPAPGLMMIGAVKMPVGRYTWMTFLVTLPKTILFMFLGYYFGRAYDTVSRYVQNGWYFILFGLVIIVVAFYVYKQITERISLRLEAI